MRVRDLRQYIKSIPGSDYNISELGTHREPFLTYMGGHYQSVEQVKKFIESSSSFATNAEEQLFYEFVQNAYDAQADSLFFFSNDKYLIVLNNGKPFYTDFDLQADEKKSGQLFNFLAKGKSDKPGDDEQMGQYGQGSKLLYTLITDVPKTGEYTDAELLVDAIYNNRKGPYLISWNSQEQLTNLLLGEKSWELSQADDYENNILFAKILYSYFPIAPGQEPALFSDNEAKSIIEVFDRLVNPRRNLQFLNSGTSLIIPLGDGKADLIRSTTNLSRVRTRLGGFSALTADQAEHKGTRLKHIYVLGQEIEQTEVKSIRWEKKQGAKTYKYHLAFNPKFAQEGFVNIFKGLPILSTKHHLGFIIDSQCFQTDDSRQRLSNPETTGKQLKDIFEELIKRIKAIKESDRETFDWIYDSIMASRIDDKEESAFLLSPFNEVIKPFLAENVRTNEGSYCKSSQAYASSEEYGFDIPLSQLGINARHWVDENIIQSLLYIGIPLGRMELSNIIADANVNVFQQWVKLMSESDYKLYQNICWKYVQNGSHTENKLFRSDKKNLYSYTELKSESPIYYGFEPNMFNGLEHILFPFEGVPATDYALTLLEKIKKNIASYRKSNVLKDTICSLLRYIVSKNSGLKSDVMNNVLLFENQLGVSCCFSQLFVETPQDSILFDTFQVKGYLPESIKSSGWMIDGKKNPKSAWNWVIGNITPILHAPEWEKYAHDYLKDIKDLYKASKPDDTTPLITNLYIDNEGKATTTVHAIVQSARTFTKTDFPIIQSLFPEESLLPLEFYGDLNDKPFDLTKITVRDMIDDGLKVSSEELAVLNKYVHKFLDKYYIKQNGNKFTIHSLEKGRNYINDLDNNMNYILEYNDFHYIPKDVQSVFSSSDLASCDIANDESLMNSIVINSEDSSLLSILPLVERCSNTNILRTYFQRITTITIDSQLSDSDYAWRIIKLAVKYKFNTDFVNVVFTKIRHKNSALEDRIVEKSVKVGNNKYELYQLDNSYKVSNDHISSFLDCLPAPDGAEFFKKEFYKGKIDIVNAQTVYNRIYLSALTLEQLRFCIEYAKTNQISNVKFTTIPSVTTPQVMDIVASNDFKEFDKYYTLRNFNAQQQIYADSDLLLTKEKLPDDLKGWLDAHTDSTSWFSSLRTSKETNIEVRTAIRDHKEYSGSLDAFALDNLRTHDTIEWLLSKNIECSSNSTEHKLLAEIIQKLPESFTAMPFFKYTGDVIKDTTDNAVYSKLKFCPYTYGKPFLRASEHSFAETLSVDSKLQQFIKQSSVYEYPSADTLRKHRLHTSPRWEVKNGISSGKYEELTYTKYVEWKSKKESDGITLWTSKSPIGVTLSITDENNKELLSVKRADADYGYSVVTKQVVVRWPNKENLSKIDTISKYSKNIFWLKDPLIAFLKMYVNETDELQQLADQNGIEMKDLVEMVKNTLSGNAIDATILSAVQKSPEVFKTMTKDLDESTLKKISDNATLVGTILNEFSAGDLKWMADLSKETIQALKQLDKSDLDKMINDAEMLSDLAEELDCENSDDLNDQLDAFKQAYKHFDRSGWDKFAKNAQNIADIVDKFDEDELKQIAENEDNLKEFLTELKQEQESDDRTASISEIIGYIGELIYEQYLLKKGIKYEFSADNGIGEYDFITYPSNSTKERYIDVKTTRNTLSDGHTPMYIHKKQDEFLRSNIGVTYRFVRISLHDLEKDLESEYERFRDQYGNIDPRKDPALRKECQDLAKRYWSQADIDEFHESSPEYRIEFVQPN